MGKSRRSAGRGEIAGMLLGTFINLLSTDEVKGIYHIKFGDKVGVLFNEQRLPCISRLS